MHLREQTAPILMRLGPSLAAALLYVTFAAFWIYDRGGYYQFEFFSIDMQSLQPFSDLQAIVTAGACWRHGVNVYAPSACMHGGVFNYSPFMLHFSALGLDPRDTPQYGLLQGAVFIAALALLPAADSAAEFALRVLTVCSSSVIFALETANFDGIVFMLVLSGVLLLNTRRLAPLGYIVFLFAAACKFYPAVLMALALRERAAVVAVMAVLGTISFGVFIALFGHGLVSALGIIPAGLPYRGVFGAFNLPFGLVLMYYLPYLTVEPHVPEFFYAVNHPLAPVLMVLGEHLLMILGVLAAFSSAPQYTAAWRRAEKKRGTIFMAGALIMVFCFYIAQNLEYRAVSMVLLVPGLWQMSRADGRVKALLIGVMLLLYAEFFRHLVFALGTGLLGMERAFYPEYTLWLIRECLWWWVIIQLGAFIICFLRDNLIRLLGEAFPAPANV